MNPRLEFLLCLGLVAVGARAADSKSPQPAQVEHAVKETDLATVKLTPQAEQRLGIVLVETSRKKVAASRLFGGDVILPLAIPGAAPDRYFPLASSTPEELLRLSDQQAVADGEVAKSEIQLAAAHQTQKRARKLVQDEAGSVRAVEDAETQVRLAEKSLEVAKIRRTLLGASVGEALQRRHVWIRMPVFAGELSLLDLAAQADVSDLAGRPGGTHFVGKRVSTPPSANPVSGTVDLFYEVQGAGDAISPGRRVSLRVPLRSETESLVVPWAAIIHDLHGNTWVYEQVAPQTFTRRRVQVDRVVGQDAVLARGPKPGSKVVTEGAAELFGTEFGVK